VNGFALPISLPYNEVPVLRTTGVLIAGAFWGIVVYGILGAPMIQLPPQFHIDAYYLMANALTVCAVGLFVGFSKINSEGLVAVVCLLAPAFLQYGGRVANPATGPQLLFPLVGTALELSLGFVVAHNLSARRDASQTPD
jgi:hypothetical protein